MYDGKDKTMTSYRNRREEGPGRFSDSSSSAIVMVHMQEEEDGWS